VLHEFCSPITGSGVFAQEARRNIVQVKIKRDFIERKS
jgi:hypothetical protein